MTGSAAATANNAVLPTGELRRKSILNVAAKERDGYAVKHRVLAGARGHHLAADSAGGLQPTPARGAAQPRLNRAGKQE